MRIQIASDLHLEFSSFKLDCTDVDVLVLAGDIHCRPQKLIKYVNKIARRYEHLQIVLVAGNHEFYGRSIADTYARLRDAGRNEYQRLHERVHLLDNSAVQLEVPGEAPVHFIGATLWCNPPDWARPVIKHTMRDFTVISDLTLQTLDDMHDAACAAIHDLLTAAGDARVVVVTHFAPTLASIHPKYLSVDKNTRALNYYYASDDEHILLAHDDITSHGITSHGITPGGQRSRLWVHGHTHACMDYTVGDTWRVVCNPRGYSKQKTQQQHPENPGFNPRFVVSI